MKLVKSLDGVRAGDFVYIGNIRNAFPELQTGWHSVREVLETTILVGGYHFSKEDGTYKEDPEDRSRILDWAIHEEIMNLNNVGLQDKDILLMFKCPNCGGDSLKGRRKEINYEEAADITFYKNAGFIAADWDVIENCTEYRKLYCGSDTCDWGSNASLDNLFVEGILVPGEKQACQTPEES